VQLQEEINIGLDEEESKTMKKKHKKKAKHHKKAKKQADEETEEKEDPEQVTVADFDKPTASEDEQGTVPAPMAEAQSAEEKP